MSSLLGFLTGSDQSWYLVLDETAIIRDRQIKRALMKENANRKDFNARIYEKQIKMRSGRITLGEFLEIVNPLNLYKFFKYSLSDII